MGDLKVCAIHQPNFFPWLGYFDKIRRADVFILMDDVDYVKGSWINRVRLEINRAPVWMTCPVGHVGMGRRIREVEINDRVPWRRKLLRTLEVQYRPLANYARVMAVLEPLILEPTSRLADFNMNAIRAICSFLGIRANLCVQSAIPAEGMATQRLINLTRAAGCDAYMCGGGADGYQEDEMFGDQGVQLIYQKFTPKPYCPADEFTPGQSVIDFLMRADPAIYPTLGAPIPGA